ncbi:MAG: hypothetical protein CL868_20355 [Cytophagaceae bacterium]|nr:hypothetical protein [Cytophagaceae bacterium]
MKNLFLIIAFATTMTAFAQEDKVEKIVTTKTTVDNGMDTTTNVTRQVKTTATKDIQLDPRDAGKVNQRMVPTETTIKTDVIYSNEGNSYALEEDAKGYNILSVNGEVKKPMAKLRKLSSVGYIYTDNDGTSFAHFDKKGNLVVETYDNATDTVIVKNYTLNKKAEEEEAPFMIDVN